jgi:cell division protein FtsA
MKKSASHRDLICGLDIGTTKVLTVVAEPEESGGIRILGIGSVPSRGLRKGVVINLEQTTADIEQSVQIAEEESGEQVHSVWVGVAGEHVRSLNSRGAIPVTKTRNTQTGEVTSADVERVVEAASAVALPLDRRVLHVLPQEYVVDSERGIRSPIGMAGVRLEANVHIVTCAVASAQNIMTCCRRADLEVEDLVLEPLASALSVLTADEMELGAVLVDIGGGTTDIAVFQNGSIRHSAVVGFGGDYITRDIAVGLRTPVESAEHIKREHGAAHVRTIGQNEFLEIPGVGGREPRALSRSMLVGIISPRLEEIFGMVREELIRARTLDIAASGMVLTGGGASLPGMSDLAEEIFACPVRIGAPHDVFVSETALVRPAYATGFGLVRHARAKLGDSAHARPSSRRWDNPASSRLKEWFQGIF